MSPAHVTLSRLAKLRIYGASLRPDWEPETKFIIFGAGRSGSTLLGEMLNTNPDVVCVGEMLASRKPAPETYLRSLARFEARRNQVKTFGLKILEYQLWQNGIKGHAVPTFLQKLVSENWKIIHISRKNAARQALSAEMARSRGRYHFRGDEERSVVEIDIPNFLREMSDFAQARCDQIQMLADIPHISVEYEEDLKNAVSHEIVLSKLAEYLNIENIFDYSSSLKVATGRDVSKVVSNFSELQQVVADSPFGTLED